MAHIIDEVLATVEGLETVTGSLFMHEVI